MSVHNAMCAATAILETGMIPMEEPFSNFKLETPGGIVDVSAMCQHGKALTITITNVPCF